MEQLSGRDIERIAAHGILSARTVRRVYDGGGNAYSRARTASAARELGLPLPPSIEPAAPNRAA